MQANYEEERGVTILFTSSSWGQTTPTSINSYYSDAAFTQSTAQLLAAQVVIPANTYWNVSEIIVTTLSTHTSLAGFTEIWTDASGEPGSSVYAHATLTSVACVAGTPITCNFQLNNVVNLAPGTYWFTWGVDVTSVVYLGNSESSGDQTRVYCGTGLASCALPTITTKGTWQDYPSGIVTQFRVGGTELIIPVSTTTTTSSSSTTGGDGSSASSRLSSFIF